MTSTEHTQERPDIFTGHHAWALSRVFRWTDQSNDTQRQEVVTALAGLSEESELLKYQWEAYRALGDSVPVTGSAVPFARTSKRARARLKKRSKAYQAITNAITTTEDPGNPIAQFTLATRTISLSNLHRFLTSQGDDKIQEVESYIQERFLESEEDANISHVRAASKLESEELTSSEKKQLTNTFEGHKVNRGALRGTGIFHRRKTEDASATEDGTNASEQAMIASCGSDNAPEAIYIQRAMIQAQADFWLPTTTIVSQALSLRQALIEADGKLGMKVIEAANKLSGVLCAGEDAYWQHPMSQIEVSALLAMRGNHHDSTSPGAGLKITTSATQTSQQTVVAGSDDPASPVANLEMVSTNSPPLSTNDESLSIVSTDLSSPRTWVFLDDDEDLEVPVMTPTESGESAPETLSRAEQDIRDILRRYPSMSLESSDKDEGSLLLASDSIRELMDLNHSARDGLFSDMYLPSTRKGEKDKTFTFKSEQHFKRVVDKANKVTAKRLKEVMRERRSYRDDVVAKTRDYFSDLSERIIAESQRSTQDPQGELEEDGMTPSAGMLERVREYHGKLRHMLSDAEEELDQLVGRPHTRRRQGGSERDKQDEESEVEIEVDAGEASSDEGEASKVEILLDGSTAIPLAENFDYGKPSMYLPDSFFAPVTEEDRTLISFTITEVRMEEWM